MEIINYTEAQRKKLVKWEWQTPNIVSGFRSVKMLRPICKECQDNPQHPVNWSEFCTHGGEDKEKYLYWSLRPKTIKIPSYEQDADGDLVLVKEDVVNKMILVPNWSDIAADLGHSDGAMPTYLHDSAGFRFPEEIGLAPMCQMYQCGKAFPRVRTTLGDYCEEYHAKIAISNERGILLPTNPRLRAERLAEVAI